MGVQQSCKQSGLPSSTKPTEFCLSALHQYGFQPASFVGLKDNLTSQAARHNWGKLVSHQQAKLQYQGAGEVVWQHMQLPHLLRWDSSRSGSQTSLKDLQSLLTSALLKPLLPAQQQQVMASLFKLLALISSVVLLEQAFVGTTTLVIRGQISLLSYAQDAQVSVPHSPYFSNCTFELKSHIFVTCNPLVPSRQVLKELELDRRLVLSLDLATDSLPHLVEHNPVIAFEVSAVQG